MSQVFNNSETNKKNAPIGALSKLEKIRADLEDKRKSSVEEGNVEYIRLLDTALGQVDTAIKEVSLNQKITNSQVKLGQIRPATEKVAEVAEDTPKVISEKEAAHIRAIRSIQGQEILPGQQFASMHGREPSNVSYMKENINGLFDLVALKG